MTHTTNATTVTQLQATISGLRARREEITAELMDAPHKRGTAWYDARVNEIQALIRSIRTRMVILDDMMDEQGDDSSTDTSTDMVSDLLVERGDDSGLDESIGDTLDAHELMDESVRTPDGVCCGDCGRAITDVDTSEPGNYYCEDCELNDFYDC